jgi:hypothetical protein
MSILTIYLPDMLDDDLPGDTLDLTAQIDNGAVEWPEWMAYDSLTETLSVTPDTNDLVETYEVTLILTDDNAGLADVGELSTTLSFDLTITLFDICEYYDCEPGEEEEEIIFVVPEVEKEVPESKTLAFWIEDIDEQGLVQLRFNEKILIPANATTSVNSTHIQLEILSDYDLEEEIQP